MRRQDTHGLPALLGAEMNLISSQVGFGVRVPGQSNLAGLGGATAKAERMFINLQPR